MRGLGGGGKMGGRRDEPLPSGVQTAVIVAGRARMVRAKEKVGICMLFGCYLLLFVVGFVGVERDVCEIAVFERATVGYK